MTNSFVLQFSGKLALDNGRCIDSVNVRLGHGVFPCHRAESNRRFFQDTLAFLPTPGSPEAQHELLGGTKPRQRIGTARHTEPRSVRTIAARSERGEGREAY